MRPVRELREGAAALVWVGGGDHAAASVAGHAQAHQELWRTPTPYLFLGFALMMGLIAVALLMLLCTSRKPSSGSSRRGSAAEEEESGQGIMMPLDREPKVVVIMAGDDMPSFIASARPFAFSTVVASGVSEQSKAEAA